MTRRRQHASTSHPAKVAVRRGLLLTRLLVRCCEGGCCGLKSTCADPTCQLKHVYSPWCGVVNPGCEDSAERECKMNVAASRIAVRACASVCLSSLSSRALPALARTPSFSLTHNHSREMQRTAVGPVQLRQTTMTPIRAPHLGGHTHARAPAPIPVTQCTRVRCWFLSLVDFMSV